MREKLYQPYVSDSRVHNQTFVKLAMTEMSTDVPDDAVIERLM